MSNCGLNAVIGDHLSSSFNWTTVLGSYAKSTASHQFVWNAKNPVYAPNAVSGSFNVNPIDGLNGFFIGQDNFI